MNTMLNTALSSLFLFVLSLCTASGQRPTSADPIDQELETFDLPPFKWSGPPDPARPKLGIYFNAVPADSTARITGRAKNPPWFVIWHVVPHLSADEAGILIGDTITAINGREIGDGDHYGEDFVNLLVREMEPGALAYLTVRRDGAVLEMPVPLLADERVPMPYTMPGRLGPIREDSWLRRTLREKEMTERMEGIAKQMRVISDIDLSRIRFAGRPNPWRLNVVTTLLNNPARTGAYGRLIVNDLWEGTEAGPGLSGGVRRAAEHLDVPRSSAPVPKLPGTPAELTDYLKSVKGDLNRAYGSIREDLPLLTADLAAMLDPTRNWESALDTINDPRLRREARNAEERRITVLFQKGDRIDFAALTEGAAKMAALADTAWLTSFAAQFAFPDRQPQQVSLPGIEGDVVYSWQTPLGLCVVGGTGPNRYTASYPFILDLGGDDVYDLPAAPTDAPRFVADLSGNDTYLSRGTAQGAGIGCVDVLVDAAGDDTYRADHFSQGAGLLGVGILADFAGDDIYTARWCAQGGAFLGIGLLYEGGGNDGYNADIYAQAFGYAKGFGALLEREGNDSYRAGWKYEDSRYPNRAHIAMSQGFGFGMRPWSIGIGTDGGIGALSDRAGDDVYASDFFSQGGSYWYAFGILHDGEGADRYTAGQYSQGSGIHLSFGALLDDAGDDMYDAYHGLEQGNAHDWSAGCLEDLSGNDSYRGSTASQGSALNVSVAWLLDRSGDDRYYVLNTDTTGSQGGGNYNRPRKHGALGMLLDFGGGADSYTDPRVVPGTALLKGEGNGLLFDDGTEK